ncbi:hypothetical protein RUM44_004296 [Polyplax serrata]|uniref:Poly(A) RNA polymerase mitochondrial-like central palm domain-containing protein n=1 Tax=Polyplax serrata TaxID=468196 RepID=A0ABR1B2F5_POLSC
MIISDAYDIISDTKAFDERVEEVFDEFHGEIMRHKLSDFHVSEIFGLRKVPRGKLKKDDIMIINENHIYCKHCNEHYYLHTDLLDINSCFVKHINTSYHKLSKLINPVTDDIPIFSWEKFGFSAHCNICGMSEIYVLVYDSSLTLQNLVEWHKTNCKMSTSCSYENDSQYMVILQRFCSLSVFVNKFTATRNNRMQCFLCNLLFDASIKEIHYHFMSELHCTSFLEFLYSTFKFRFSDLLNGFHMEAVIKWILNHDIYVKPTEMLFKSQEKICCKDQSNNQNPLPWVCQYDAPLCPMIITEVLTNVSNLADTNKCVFCQEGKTDESHIKSTNHITNVQNYLQNNLKNKVDHSVQLLSVYKEQLRPFGRYVQYIKKFSIEDNSYAKASLKAGPRCLVCQKCTDYFYGKQNILCENCFCTLFETKVKEIANKFHEKITQHVLSATEDPSLKIHLGRPKHKHELTNDIPKTRETLQDTKPPVTAGGGNKEPKKIHYRRPKRKHELANDVPKTRETLQGTKPPVTAGGGNKEPKKIHYRRPKRKHELANDVPKTRETLQGTKPPVTAGGGNKEPKKIHYRIPKRKHELANDVPKTRETLQGTKPPVTAGGGNKEPKKMHPMEPIHKHELRNDIPTLREILKGVTNINLSNEIKHENIAKDSLKRERDRKRNSSQQNEGKQKAKQNKQKVPISKSETGQTVTHVNESEGREQKLRTVIIKNFPPELKHQIKFLEQAFSSEKLRSVEIQNDKIILNFPRINLAKKAANKTIIFNNNELKLDYPTTSTTTVFKKVNLHNDVRIFLTNKKQLQMFYMSCLENDLTEDDSICQEISYLLQDAFPSNQCFIFGSRLTGLFSAPTDVDIFVDCGGMFEGNKYVSKEVMRKLIKTVQTCLTRNSKNFRQPLPVFNARVPILSIRNTYRNLKYDLSFLNGLSVQNSRMIKWIISFDPRIKAMILFLKYWICLNKLHGRPSFSSYAMTLMVIFFLQQLSDPILPCIEFFKVNHVGPRLTIAGWDCNFSVPKDKLPKISNNSSLPELLLGFFNLYATFNFKKYIVSPLTGSPVER